MAVLHEGCFFFVGRDVADDAVDLLAELLGLHEDLGPEVCLGEVRAEARSFCEGEVVLEVEGCVRRGYL